MNPEEERELGIIAIRFPVDFLGLVMKKQICLIK